MLHANGEGLPVGGSSEIRAGVAIVGGGPGAAVAASIIRQQTPDQSVVIVDGHSEPELPASQTLQPEGEQNLREIGLDEHTDQQAMVDHATALAAAFLSGVAVERVQATAGRIDRLHLTNGRSVVADWYIDTSRPAGERNTDKNCLLCGEASQKNFSTALILSRNAGWTVVALHRGGHDQHWLLWSYQETTRRHLSELERRAAGPELELYRYNIIKPNLVGAQQGEIAGFRDGEVHRVPCYERDGQVLPIAGVYEKLLATLKHHTVIADVLVELEQPGHPPLDHCIDGLESMLHDGWLIGKLDRRRPLPEWPAADGAKPSPTISTLSQTRESIRK